MPDIVDVIKGQHRQIEKLLEKAQEGGPEAGNLLRQVKQLLQPHSEAEESFVYPTIKDHQKEEAEQVHDSLAEHEHIEQLLDELTTEDPEGPGWDGKLAAFIGELQHHVEEEEQDLLPVLSKELSAQERNEMGERFARQTGSTGGTGQNGGAGSGSSGDDEPTKEELYEKAKEQDVPGRSSMTKDELKKAVEE